MVSGHLQPALIGPFATQMDLPITRPLCVDGFGPFATRLDRAICNPPWFDRAICNQRMSFQTRKMVPNNSKFAQMVSGHLQPALIEPECSRIAGQNEKQWRRPFKATFVNDTKRSTSARGHAKHVAWLQGGFVLGR